MAHTANAEFMPATPSMFHQCLADLCRECGVRSCPSEEDVSSWLKLVVPGDSLGQVISLDEFVGGCQVLCPNLFQDFAGPGNPAVADSGASVRESNSYGILQRKNNATALVDFDNAGALPPPPAATGTMVLVSTSEHIAAAVRKDRRRSRRAEVESGIKIAKVPVKDKVLEKTRITDALRSGPPPHNAIKAMREAKAVAKARRMYSAGLSTSLGSNMAMVRRHNDMESVERMREARQRSVAAVTEARRSELEEHRGHAEALRQVELAKRRMGRKGLVTGLREGVKKGQEARERRVEDMRASKNVLHWAEHKSGLIPKDEVLSERISSATSRKEWQGAVDDERSRVAAIHHARFGEMLESRACWSSQRDRLATRQVATMDGSAVLDPAGDAAGDADIGASTVASSYGIVESPLDLGSIVEPPANMKAAARAFGMSAAPPREAPFLSTVARL